jgi:hypothetical protein
MSEDCHSSDNGGVWYPDHDDPRYIIYPDHDDPRYIIIDRREPPSWLLGKTWDEIANPMPDWLEAAVHAALIRQFLKEEDDAFLRGLKIQPIEA